MVAVPREATEVEEWLLSASVALVTLCVMNSALLLCCLFGRGKHEEAEEFVSESRMRRVLRRYLEVKAGKRRAADRVGKVDGPLNWVFLSVNTLLFAALVT